MTLIRTLLAVWLTLAVPAAGVAAASAAPDCSTQVAVQAPDEGGHARQHGEGGDECKCPCEPTHCGSASPVTFGSPDGARAAPRAAWGMTAPHPLLPAGPPDAPFKPPISG